MAQVIIRNLPDDVVAGLKVRARQRKHSLEQELREILRAASEPSREAIIADMDRIRAMTPIGSSERRSKRPLPDYSAGRCRIGSRRRMTSRAS
jgi:plasmid stability protein